MGDKDIQKNTNGKLLGTEVSVCTCAAVLGLYIDCDDWTAPMAVLLLCTNEGSRFSAVMEHTLSPGGCLLK